MSDLISRTEVLELIEDIKCNPDVPKNYGTLLDIMRQIGKLPTAYDVEKVVQGVHEYFCEKIDDCVGESIPSEILDYNKAICNIIHNGGKE